MWAFIVKKLFKGFAVRKTKNLAKGLGEKLYEEVKDPENWDEQAAEELKSLGRGLFSKVRQKENDSDKDVVPFKGRLLDEITQELADIFNIPKEKRGLKWFVEASDVVIRHMELVDSAEVKEEKDEDEEKEEVEEHEEDENSGMFLFLLGITALGLALWKYLPELKKLLPDAEEAKEVEKSYGVTYAQTSITNNQFVKAVFKGPVPRVSSGYGERSLGYHRGVDFAVPVGTPVYSPFDGVVIESMYDKRAGNYIKIKSLSDNDGVGLLHLSEVKVEKGQKVTKGQLVGLTGNTGRSTGPHLHLARYKVDTIQRDGQTTYKTTPYDFTAFDDSSEPEVTLSDVDELKNLGASINNPFSIKYDPKNDWLGQTGYKQVGDNKFAVFESEYAGIRAGAKLIGNQQTLADASMSGGEYITLGDFVDRYVTSSDGNDVTKYLKNLSKQTGYTPEQRIDLRDPSTLSNVSRSVAFLESSSVLSEPTMNKVVNRVTLSRSDSLSNRK